MTHRLLTIRTVWALPALLVCALAPAIPKAEESPRVLRPHEVVAEASQELLAAMDGRREVLAEHPEQLHHLVDAVLRPRFDVRYAARLILAENWSRATQQQRADFIEALYGSLVRRYAVGLLYHSETRVRISPLRLKMPDPDEPEEFATVWTTVILDDGTKVPVNYEMRWIDPQWKVYDVKIEGRSYVAYFRQVVREDIQDRGIDAVVEELNST
jgi:ABC-type transporter MlaC component